MRGGRSIGLSAVLAFWLAACAVGPDFRSPDPPETVRYLAERQPVELASADIPGGETQRIVQELDIPGQWWVMFQSRPLNDLVDRALRANPDIATAKAALQVAQQTARAQRAALFPTVSSGGSAAQNQAPTVLSAPTAENTYVYGLFTASLNIVYVLDVWGGVRRAAEAAEAQAEAQCFQLEAAYLTLASNVVVAAITEASLRAQIDATRRIIAAQRETLEMLRRQVGLGQLAGADIATQEAAVAQSEATLPPLEKALDQQRNLLATLTGRLPSEPLAERFELGELKLPAELPLSLPSKMVEQRPDVRAAEATLHSAAAQIGVAIANQLPQVNLSALVGSQALVVNQLFSAAVGPATSTVGGGFVQTLLEGGALLAKRRAAQAAYEQAKGQYQAAVLAAFRNVADTLRALEHDAAALRAAVNAERAAATSVATARRRLALGETTYLNVLLSELAYQQALLNRVGAQADRLNDSAALIQALGGGWWNRDVEGGGAGKRSVCRPSRQGTATATAQ